MYVVYYGIGNSFSGSLATQLHLNKVPKDKTKPQQLNTVLQYLIDLEGKAMGRLLFIGNDANNNQVFLLNTGFAETIVLPALKSVFDILQINPDRLLLVDTTEITNYSFYFGRLLYRLGLTSKGLKLMSGGVSKEFTKIEELVKDICTKLNNKGS